MTDDPLRAALERLHEAAWSDDPPVFDNHSNDINDCGACGRIGAWVAALASVPDEGPTETCPTCMQPVRVPQRGDHDYGIPLSPAASAPDEGPRCSECGVPISEHPNTDACAIAQESRPATVPALDVEFDPDPRWKPGEHDDLRVFVSIAARNMFVRLREKARVWGTSWRTDYYPDNENIERLRRAVEHLIAAVDAAHRDDANPAQMAEPWKRAADVANQAFMLADPLRGWHEDAARRAEYVRLQEQPE